MSILCSKISWIYGKIFGEILLVHAIKLFPQNSQNSWNSSKVRWIYLILISPIPKTQKSKNSKLCSEMKIETRFFSSREQKKKKSERDRFCVVFYVRFFRVWVRTFLFTNTTINFLSKSEIEGVIFFVLAGPSSLYSLWFGYNFKCFFLKNKSEQ